jgi:hypothetical protein
MTPNEKPRHFRCSMCKDEFMAWKLDSLCAMVNEHNMAEHKKMYCAWWAPSTILYSNFYSGPDKPTTPAQYQAEHPEVKPEYTKPWGTAENSAHPFAITPEDEKFLEAFHVKWED